MIDKANNAMILYEPNRHPFRDFQKNIAREAIVFTLLSLREYDRKSPFVDCNLESRVSIIQFIVYQNTCQIQKEICAVFRLLVASFVQDNFNSHFKTLAGKLIRRLKLCEGLKFMTGLHLPG